MINVSLESNLSVHENITINKKNPTVSMPNCDEF